MRIVRAADYRRMPWKNGGGSTTEVAIFPADATLDTFDWRISMAHVAMPGPFSRFPGIDRTLAVIEGRGIWLTVDGVTVKLEQASPPYFFRGDIDASATLIDGPIDDLNIMSRRTRYRHRMTRHRAHETVHVPADADMAALLPCGGNAEIALCGQPITVTDGDTILLDRADIETAGIGPLRVDAGAAEAALHLVAFWQNGA
jgi:environmental stress-induced protein Ves